MLYNSFIKAIKFYKSQVFEHYKISPPFPHYEGEKAIHYNLLRIFTLNLNIYFNNVIIKNSIITLKEKFKPRSIHKKIYIYF